MVINYSSPFKRIYFDVPNEVHAAMVLKAKAAGLTQKEYLARLIGSNPKGGKAGKK